MQPYRKLLSQKTFLPRSLKKLKLLPLLLPKRLRLKYPLLLLQKHLKLRYPLLLLPKPRAA